MNAVWDVAIVGAGPAGTAAALRALAVRPTARVALVDRARFPRDKSCGDGISPTAVELLDSLGVPEVLAGARRIDRLRIVAPDGGTVEGQVGAEGCVLPRETFDARLVDAAAARGATLVHERVRGIEQRDDRVVLDGGLAARVVVGADGANSIVRREVGAGSQSLQHSGVAVRGYLPMPDAPPELLFRYPREPYPAYAWRFPAPEGRVNIGIGVFGAHDRPTRRMLMDRLSQLLTDDAHRADNIRGHLLPLATERPDPSHGRVLLAGDAASLVNPLTGEGIATALLSGMLAGQCAVTHADAPGPAYATALSRRLQRFLRHVGIAARACRSVRGTSAAVEAARSSRRVFDDLTELSLGTGVVTLPLVWRTARAFLAGLVRSGSTRAVHR